MFTDRRLLCSFEPERIVNVGGGTGSYEPDDRRVVAVEPSTVMIAQRPRDRTAHVVRASGDRLPFTVVQSTLLAFGLNRGA